MVDPHYIVYEINYFSVKKVDGANVFFNKKTI
jgi:hypothetical protein